VLAYFVVVIAIGLRGRKHSGNEEGFFLAGRRLGKLYQFFLNFGNATDANGAVSTASLVYQKGVSGVWLSLQTLFMNPYYWFMNPWFRRVRLVTVADLFHDRFGTRPLAVFYAVFQIFATIFVIIGFGNLVAYKVTKSLMLKPAVEWTATEQASVDGYRELRGFESRLKEGETFSTDEDARLTLLREESKRGELRSNISYLDSEAGKWGFYLIYSIIVGSYIVMGGLSAAALNEAFQGVLIVIFSILLIPGGLIAIGGWDALSERVAAANFELLTEGGIGFWELIGIFVISLVQIHGIIGNMSVSGSAKNEFAARFGAVSGTYAKRLMIILWAFAGLIAIALYQGGDALSDPDSAWGNMALGLLGPGFLGLMMAGLLAANMSTIAAQTMAVSALFTRNVYKYIAPNATERGYVNAGRIAIVVILSFGVIAAAGMDNVYGVIQDLLTVNVPFGAAVMLIFFWRRLSLPAVWTAVVVSAMLNIIGPKWVVPLVEGVRESPTYAIESDAGTLNPAPVFFERVVRINPADPESPLEGEGRFHVELAILDACGLDVAAMSPSNRNAARFLFDGAFPFVVLILVSLATSPPRKELVDQFFGKMKTPVGATPELELAAMEETRQQPHRFDHEKMLGPSSNWEFTRWNRIDAIGFLACLALSFGILAMFWGLLRWAAA
jgi:Na+/proline symporter